MKKLYLKLKQQPLNIICIFLALERKGEKRYSSLLIRMVKTKTKPLLPSLREKKRYLAYEVISKQRFHDAVEINKAIFDAASGFLGTKGLSEAGILAMDEQWNENMQRGMLRVNNKHVENLKASLIFVESVKGNDVILKSVGISGILKKAQQRYLN